VIRIQGQVNLTCDFLVPSPTTTRKFRTPQPDPFVVSDADTMLTYLRSVEGKYKKAHEIPDFPDVDRYPAHELSNKWLTPLKKGDLVPDVKFQTRTRIADPSDPENPFDWKVRTTQDYFAGKRVVVFAVPGAFGPVCSYHLPEYESAYDDILKLGVDDVYCTFNINLLFRYFSA
jgi:peroxiredoxin